MPSARLTACSIVTPPIPGPTRGQANVINVDQSPDGTDRGHGSTVSSTPTQPLVSALDQIVVYGSNRHTTGSSIGPEVTLPATLDGGHGGVNVDSRPAAVRLAAARLVRQEHAVNGGSGASNDTLIGRKGHVKFVQSGGTDVIFAGVPEQRSIPRTGHSRHESASQLRPRRGPSIPASAAPVRHLLQVRRQAPGQDRPALDRPIEAVLTGPLRGTTPQERLRAEPVRVLSRRGGAT